MKFAIRRAGTTNDAIYRKRYAHAMKSALRQVRMADLISSEAVGGRFHPNSFGFHPAKQDFIKFVWFVEIASSLQAFFVFTSKIQIVHFIPLSFNLWGIVQLLIRLKNY